MPQSYVLLLFNIFVFLKKRYYFFNLIGKEDLVNECKKTYEESRTKMVITVHQKENEDSYQIILNTFNDLG